MSTDGDGGDGPADRVTELADQLTRYRRRYEAEQDSRAVFAYAYATLTRGLADRLARPDHGFDDPVWVADLATAFGDRYQAAMNSIDGGTVGPDESVPDPWVAVYRAICLEPSTVLEDLVFSMGAHITYDLPHALVDVGMASTHLRDYHLMNEVLADGTEAIQMAVTGRYNRLFADLDRLAGGADEALTNYQIRIGRSMAWYNAMRLETPGSREQAAASIERTTPALIASVRGEGQWLLRWTLRLVRMGLSTRRTWPDSESVTA